MGKNSMEEKTEEKKSSSVVQNNVSAQEPQKEQSKKPEKKPKKEEELQQQVKELTDLLQRLQAEFENYKKKVSMEKAEFCRYANAELVLKLLPLLDSFEQALSNKQLQADGEFVKGIELIYSQFFDALEKSGLKQVDALFKRFDPYTQEALLQEESDGEENIVLEMLQKGYLFNGKLLRIAKVKVSKKRGKSQ